MAFKGQVLVRSKVVIDNTTLEQLNTFTYLECQISYEEEKVTTSKTSIFLQILGILNNVLKQNLVQI
jgi:hypothetical protein